MAISPSFLIHFPSSWAYFKPQTNLYFSIYLSLSLIFFLSINLSNKITNHNFQLHPIVHNSQSQIPIPTLSHTKSNHISPIPILSHAENNHRIQSQLTTLHTLSPKQHFTIYNVLGLCCDSIPKPSTPNSLDIIDRSHP